MSLSLLCRTALVVILSTTLAAVASAATKDVVEHPLQPGDRSSPRATLETFLHNVEETWTKRLEGESIDRASETMRRARRCLDLGHIASSQQELIGTEAAFLLFDVLNRIEIPPLREVPDARDSGVQERGKWRVPNTPITIVRIDEGPRSGEWLFSSEVVDRAKELYRRTQQLPPKPGAVVDDGYQLYFSSPGNWISARWVEALPDPLWQVFWEQAVWQWIVSVTVLSIFLLIAFVVLRRGSKRSADDKKGSVKRLRAPLLILFLSGISLYILAEQVNLLGGALAAFRAFFNAAFFLAAIAGTIELGRILRVSLAKMPRFRDDPLSGGFVALAVQLFVGTAVVILVGFWAYSLGLPVLAVLTGLGVGGIAVALAAQRTLENFIGSMTLFADPPVRIGDRCKFGGKVGNVEHIGLRSTRIRTLERSVITVPNAEFSRLQIENLAERDRRLFRSTISLFLETSSAQIDQVRTQILELLKKDARVIGSGTRVELIALGPTSIDLEIFCYLRAKAQAEFLAIRRDLLLDIIRIVENAGTGLAAPAATHYVREQKQ